MYKIFQKDVEVIENRWTLRYVKNAKLHEFRHTSHSDKF